MIEYLLIAPADGSFAVMAKTWDAAAVEALIDEFELSNAKLAALCGVHWTTVSRWRSGQKPTALAQTALTAAEKKLRQQSKK